MSYKVFTLEIGQQVKVEPGARIDRVQIGHSIEVDAICVGEQGRGRSRGILPVSEVPMVPCPHTGLEPYFTSDLCPSCGVEYTRRFDGKRTHPDKGEVKGKLMAASLGKTKSGPRLETAEAPTTDSHAILVLRTQIGFRGSNAHTGDRSGWSCKCGAEGLQTEIASCLACGAGLGKGAGYLFHPFPGEVLAKGTIAQGDAGGMGSGEQIIALLPKGAVFRVKLTGRMYGHPEVRYGVYDGNIVHVLTPEERLLADLF